MAVTGIPVQQSQRLDIVAQQNPFLDPFSSPPGGIVTVQGVPLSRIKIPAIQTLVSKTAENSGNLATVSVNDALLKAGITPRQTVLTSNEAIGIELNLNLFGNMPTVGNISAQLTPAELQTGQVVGRIIPTSFPEARSVLHLITSQRTGSRNIAFNINELKRIAKSLGLQAIGNKDVLANRIRTEIVEFYNIQSE